MVKLGDFGLSKLMQSHDYASTYVGTPYYMSPEICCAERYTLASDVWSLGCIMYEMCTGSPPFDAKSHFDLVKKIKAGHFEPIPSTYSIELSNVISACLKTNPRLRPSTKQLIHMPVVRMMRKEREMVELGKKMRAREQEMNQKVLEAQNLHANLKQDAEHKASDMRADIEASVRREWEVRARLEIDRQVEEKTAAELQRLRGLFDDEVHAKAETMATKRFETLLATRLEAALAEQAQATQTPTTGTVTSPADSAPAGTPTTELTSLSFDLPVEAAHRPKKPQLSTRTPFSRARTNIEAPSPVDVDMVSPSPYSLASLALSPRRQAALAKGLTGNIFVANAAAQAGGPAPRPAITDTAPPP